jgi:hypothetical protein
MGEEEEPLARDTTIVERVLAFELDHQPLTQVFGPKAHDGRKAVFEHPGAPHAHVTLGVGDQAHRRLAAEIDDLPAVVALVLRCVCIDLRGQPGVVPCGRARVVVYKVDTSSGGHAHLPSRWQRSEGGAIRHRRAGRGNCRG